MSVEADICSSRYDFKRAEPRLLSYHVVFHKVVVASNPGIKSRTCQNFFPSFQCDLWQVSASSVTYFVFVDPTFLFFFFLLLCVVFALQIKKKQSEQRKQINSVYLEQLETGLNNNKHRRAYQNILERSRTIIK